MRVVGWDIGGANLKQALADGRAWSAAFELWRKPDDLAPALEALLSQAGRSVDAVAVTMTGELADCFTTKAEGVDRILTAVEQVAGRRPVLVWTTQGKFVAPAHARAWPLAAAAANWHALATWCGRCALRDEGQSESASERARRTAAALLIDIGSTTTDVIPLRSGRPCSQALTDGTRLQSGELVYSGVRRTPVCAVTPRVLWRGVETPLAAEWFATMHDVYLLTGDTAENANDCGTANGRPATVAAAHDRLARMLCCDRHELPLREAQDLAAQLAQRQQQTIAAAVSRVWRRLTEQGGISAVAATRGGTRGLVAPDDASEAGVCDTVIVSGSGEFLARRVLDDLPGLAALPRISLTERLGAEAATAACAYAVAVLAERE